MSHVTDDDRYVKFYMNIIHKDTYKFCVTCILCINSYKHGSKAQFCGCVLYI
jgi:hypothetical protein